MVMTDVNLLLCNCPLPLARSCWLRHKLAAHSKGTNAGLLQQPPTKAQSSDPAYRSTAIGGRLRAQLEISPGVGSWRLHGLSHLTSTRCSIGAAAAAEGATYLRFWRVLWIYARIAIPTVDCHIIGQHLQHLCSGHGSCRQPAGAHMAPATPAPCSAHTLLLLAAVRVSCRVQCALLLVAAVLQAAASTASAAGLAAPCSKIRRQCKLATHDSFGMMSKLPAAEPRHRVLKVLDGIPYVIIMLREACKSSQGDCRPATQSWALDSCIATCHASACCLPGLGVYQRAAKAGPCSISSAPSYLPQEHCICYACMPMHCTVELSDPPPIPHLCCLALPCQKSST